MNSVLQADYLDLKDWHAAAGNIAYTLQDHAARGAFWQRPEFAAVDAYISQAMGSNGYTLADALQAANQLSESDVDFLYEAQLSVLAGEGDFPETARTCAKDCRRCPVDALHCPQNYFDPADLNDPEPVGTIYELEA